VIATLSSGESTKQIAEKRGVGVYGVRKVVKSIYVKTGCNRRIQLILWAREDCWTIPASRRCPHGGVKIRRCGVLWRET
jgi:hypothetical protein